MSTRIVPADALHAIETRRSLLPPPDTSDDPRWQRSWRHLFERYQPAMERFVQGVLARAGGRPQDREEARDIVQAYLTDAIEKGWLSREGADIRCFRAWLQVQLKRYVHAWLRHRTAAKRDPGSMEDEEHLARVEGAADDPADQELDAGWVEVAKERALEALGEGSETYAEVIRDLLRTHGEGSTDLGERIGRNEKQLVHLRHRARKRFALLFYEELRLTVRDDEAYAALGQRLAPYLP